MADVLFVLVDSDRSDTATVSTQLQTLLGDQMLSTNLRISPEPIQYFELYTALVIQRNLGIVRGPFSMQSVATTVIKAHKFPG